MTAKATPVSQAVPTVVQKPEPYLPSEEQVLKFQQAWENEKIVSGASCLTTCVLTYEYKFLNPNAPLSDKKLAEVLATRGFSATSVNNRIKAYNFLLKHVPFSADGTPQAPDDPAKAEVFVKLCSGNLERDRKTDEVLDANATALGYPPKVAKDNAKSGESESESDGAGESDESDGTTITLTWDQLIDVAAQRANKEGITFKAVMNAMAKAYGKYAVELDVEEEDIEEDSLEDSENISSLNSDEPAPALTKTAHVPSASLKPTVAAVRERLLAAKADTRKALKA